VRAGGRSRDPPPHAHALIVACVTCSSIGQVAIRGVTCLLLSRCLTLIVVRSHLFTKLPRSKILGNTYPRSCIAPVL
jgi:hypothetical protein